MFESITKKFQDIKRHLFTPGHLTEKNIQDGLREIRTALLEADVNYKVVKEFINKVKVQAVGEQVIKSVQPAEQIIKIVSDELTTLMGPVDHAIKISEKGPTIIMMVGLQGSGKTTSCAKLAKYFRDKKGLKPLMVAADLQRPAAIEQLKVLGETLEIPVFSITDTTPQKVCQQAIPYAKKENCDLVILDTAGRLHIDEKLMAELGAIHKKVVPDNIFLVCDAMTGQDAVNSAKEFNAKLEIDGVILTKLDGDARGGAALSIKAVTNKTIKFIGVGEKLDRLEEFHPDRMASRILGMGDIVTLVEKAEELIDEEEAEKMQEKILSASFTLEDFISQFQMIKKMGSFQDVLGMLPGGIGPQLQGMEIDEKAISHVEAIIYSMTPQERNFPDIIDGKRRARIARGSGTNIQEVNQLLKQFREMRNMMRNMGKFGGMLGKLVPGMGGGLPGMGGSSKRSSTKKKKRKGGSKSHGSTNKNESYRKNKSPIL